MKCYEVDLSKMLKVTMLRKSILSVSTPHVTRYVNEYILYIVASGSLQLEHNGEVLELTSGDVCIFNKGEFQRPLKNTECEFYFLHFETDGFSEHEMSEEEYLNSIRQRKTEFVKADVFGSKSYDHIKALLLRRFNISDKGRLEHIIDIFKNNTVHYGYNTPEWRLNISMAAAKILMKLEDICVESIDKGYVGKNGRIYDTVRRISDYVEEHFCENFGSSDIERDLLINFDYANRIFKRVMGSSIIKYRNRLRINTAKTLLGSKTMEATAWETGFRDRYYFSRCFKKFEGVSPEEYRESMRQKEAEDNGQ